MINQDYIYEVYRTGSFSKAAKKLFLTQPALSTAVTKAEQALGYQIFNRAVSPIALTEEGQVYIEAIEKIHAIEAERDLRIEELAHAETGKLSIGGSNLYIACVLPPILKEFLRMYPRIRTEIVEVDAQQLYRNGTSPEVDLIIDGGHYDKSSFYADRLYREHVVLAVNKNNPVNRRLTGKAYSNEEICAGKHLSDPVYADLDEFQRCPFIILKEGNDIRKRSTDIFRHHDFTPVSLLHVNQLLTAYHLTLYDLGCAFLTDTIVKSSEGAEKLSYYLIEDTVNTRTCFIAYNRSAIMTNAMRRFLETAHTIYR